MHWWPASRVAPGATEAALTAEEQAAARGIGAAARREEFVRARYLLRALTGSVEALPRSADGVQAWPAGVVGSITHKSGHVGLALADGTRHRTVGIDGEDLGRVKAAFAPRLASDAEAGRLAALAATTGRAATDWLGVLFSFKEALFKAHYPLGRTMFYFLDAEVTAITPADATRGVLEATLLVDVSPVARAGSTWHGAYRFHDEDGMRLVLTATAT